MDNDLLSFELATFILEICKYIAEFLIECFRRHHLGQLFYEIPWNEVDVQLKQMGIVKFFILRWILALTIEKADFCFEPLDKLVLLLQLRLAHYLFKWEIQRAQTG